MDIVQKIFVVMGVLFVAAEICKATLGNAFVAQWGPSALIGASVLITVWGSRRKRK